MSVCLAQPVGCQPPRAGPTFGHLSRTCMGPGTEHAPGKWLMGLVNDQGTCWVWGGKRPVSSQVSLGRVPGANNRGAFQKTTTESGFSLCTVSPCKVNWDFIGNQFLRVWGFIAIRMKLQPNWAGFGGSFVYSVPDSPYHVHAMKSMHPHASL